MAAPATVLVTGGTGLVGEAIRAYIATAAAATPPSERWVFLSSADGDLRDRAATFALFARHRPTSVIHLAAFVGGLYANMKQPVEFFRCARARAWRAGARAAAARPHPPLPFPPAPPATTC